MVLRSVLPYLTAASIAVTVSIAPAQSQALKIGVFDPDRIANETAEGARIKARLSSFQDVRRAELEAVQQEISTLQQDMVNTGASLSSAKRKQLLLTMRKKQAELESLQKISTQELQLEVEEAELEWQSKVLTEVRALGREQSFTIILQRDLVAYSTPLVDVTDEVIARIDALADASATQ